MRKIYYILYTVLLFVVFNFFFLNDSVFAVNSSQDSLAGVLPIPSNQQLDRSNFNKNKVLPPLDEDHNGTWIINQEDYNGNDQIYIRLHALSTDISDEYKEDRNSWSIGSDILYYYSNPNSNELYYSLVSQELEKTIELTSKGSGDDWNIKEDDLDILEIFEDEGLDDFNTFAFACVSKEEEAIYQQGAVEFCSEFHRQNKLTDLYGDFDPAYHPENDPSDILYIDMFYMKEPEPIYIYYVDYYDDDKDWDFSELDLDGDDFFEITYDEDDSINWDTSTILYSKIYDINIIDQDNSLDDIEQYVFAYACYEENEMCDKNYRNYNYPFGTFVLANEDITLFYSQTFFTFDFPNEMKWENMKEYYSNGKLQNNDANLPWNGYCLEDLTNIDYKSFFYFPHITIPLTWPEKPLNVDWNTENSSVGNKYKGMSIFKKCKDPTHLDRFSWLTDLNNKQIGIQQAQLVAKDEIDEDEEEDIDYLEYNHDYYYKITSDDPIDYLEYALDFWIELNNVADPKSFVLKFVNQNMYAQNFQKVVKGELNQTEFPITYYLMPFGNAYVSNNQFISTNSSLQEPDDFKAVYWARNFDYGFSIPSVNLNQYKVIDDLYSYDASYVSTVYNSSYQRSYDKDRVEILNQKLLLMHDDTSTSMTWGDAKVNFDPTSGKLEVLKGTLQYNKNYVDNDQKILKEDVKEINFKESVQLPKDASFIFSGFENLKDFSGLDLVDTRNTENMHALFQKTGKYLSALDLSSFDMSKVVDTSFMFSDMLSIKKIIFKKQDNAFINIKTTESMFSNMPTLEEIDIEKMQTPSLINTKAMFLNTKHLKDEFINNFVKQMNMKQVTDMQQMFSGLDNTQLLDLSSWQFDAKDVKRDNIFFGMKKMSTLILPHSFGQLKNTGLPFPVKTENTTGGWMIDSPGINDLSSYQAYPDAQKFINTYSTLNNKNQKQRLRWQTFGIVQMNYGYMSNQTFIPIKDKQGKPITKHEKYGLYTLIDLQESALLKPIGQIEPDYKDIYEFKHVSDFTGNENSLKQVIVGVSPKAEMIGKETYQQLYAIYQPKTQILFLTENNIHFGLFHLDTAEKYQSSIDIYSTNKLSIKIINGLQKKYNLILQEDKPFSLMNGKELQDYSLFIDDKELLKNKQIYILNGQNATEYTLDFEPDQIFLQARALNTIDPGVYTAQLQWIYEVAL